MLRTSLLPALFATLLLLQPPLLQAQPTADEVLLHNGSRIMGTITGVRDGAVTIETDFAGPLVIALNDIAGLRTHTPMDVQLQDLTLLNDLTITLQDEQLTLAGDDEQTRQVALEELLILNPAPWEAGIGYNWSGRAAVAFSLQRGNTDTDELDYNINSVWRSDDDRYTINAVADVDEANGVKSADSWRINGKYDNFFDGDLYWGVNAYMESDEFADLELRYFLGPYVGREFYTAPLFSLSAEMGASYVNENFIVAEDQDYPAANWALDISSNYLGGDSRLYFNQLGIWNLDQTDNVIINTTLGLSIPLLWRVTAAAEIVLDYDSGAVEGVEELDQTYRFNIGYTW